jgi:hypothetical protein
LKKTWWALLTSRSSALSASTALGNREYQSAGERFEVVMIEPTRQRSQISS